MAKLEDLINYFDVGIFPNLSATILAAIGSYQLYNNNHKNAFYQIAASGINLVAGYLKFIEYEKIKDSVKRHGWKERLVRPKTYSPCQRHLVKKAAKELGYLDQYEKLCDKLGHKWYHLLPKVHRYKDINNDILNMNVINEEYSGHRLL